MLTPFFSTRCASDLAAGAGRLTPMRRARMIIDSQVHLIPKNTGERPWRTAVDKIHGYSEFGIDRLLNEMDAAGVDARSLCRPPLSMAPGTKARKRTRLNSSH